MDAEELSRPQAKYFFYYPLVLAAAAVLLWIYPTDLITAVSSTIGTVVSCIMMWEFLFTNQVIRLSRVCAMGLVIGYAAGTLNSWLTIPRGEYPLAVAVGQTVPELANGVSVALMGCAVLLLLGELLEKPILTMAQPLVITGGIKRLILINSAIIAIAFAAGKIHQGRMKAAGAGHVGVVAIFLDFLLDPTAILAIIAFLLEKNMLQRLLLGAISIFLMLMLLTQGRMNLVYPSLVMIGLARYAGYRWSDLSIPRIILIGAAIAFAFVGVVIYQAFRLAGNANSGQSISAEANTVQRWATEGRAWQIASNSSVQNLERRTLVVTFLGDLLYQTRSKSPAYGADLLLQSEIAVPSLIYRNKPTTVEEILASETFGEFYPDEPNSLFTLGAVDFGVWGVMIYPIVILLLFSGFIRLVGAYLSCEVFLYGISLFATTALTAELELTNYLIDIRDLITFAFFLYLVSKLPSFKLTRDG